MNNADPLMRLPNGKLHFLVVVGFMFREPVVQELENGEQARVTGAHISYRITADSFGQAVSMLETHLASQRPYDLMAEHQAHVASFEFEICSPDNLRKEFHRPGVVSESGTFYFDEANE